MSDVVVTYKNEQIAELNASGGVTLKTAGRFCDGDISLTYQAPGTGSYLDNAFGPFVGRAPEASYPGNIVVVTNGSSMSPADVLGHSFVGYTVVVIATMKGVVADYCSISGDTQFSAIYESAGTKLKAWKGVLADNTTITNSHSSYAMFVQMITIANGYDVSLNSDLTGYVPVSSGTSYRAEINTDYLKTAPAFKVGAKLPNNYGIMCLSSRYDFSDSATYNPAIWEPIDRFIKLPEICLRRLNGSNFETGLGVFLKVDPDSYIQYFSRGSVHGKINTSGSVLYPANATGVSSGYPALATWYEAPTWENADLDVMFLDVTPIS